MYGMLIFEIDKTKVNFVFDLSLPNFVLTKNQT